MKTIWKSTLQLKPIQTLEIPENAEFLTARDQNDKICVGYTCDPDRRKRDVLFYVVGTGHDHDGKGKYLGTAMLQGHFMFHVFVHQQVSLIEESRS
jgi:hypothetical protein